MQITTPSEGDVVINQNPPEDQAHEDAFVAPRDP
jgi:hypothetical protein